MDGVFGSVCVCAIGMQYVLTLNFCNWLEISLGKVLDSIDAMFALMGYSQLGGSRRVVTILILSKLSNAQC
jgi:hypothetical protein